MKCRFCNTLLEKKFLDLGKTPLANSYLKQNELTKPESYFPLCAYLCEKCFLVQVEDVEKPEHIFSSYAYFSSFSTTWLKHVKKFADFSIKKFNLNENSLVVEIASNDGYLLQNFKKKNIPILGIEPASNIAKIAEENGVPTIVKFFGKKTAQKLVELNKKADLLIAFNVLPHVPNINDFLQGMKILLKSDGITVIQFSAYMIPLIKYNEFDMIYHEHFSYFSLFTIQKILEYHKLVIFDVEELQIHGGSLRLYIKHRENNQIKINDSVSQLTKKEKEFGIIKPQIYLDYQNNILNIRNNIRDFLINEKKSGKKIVCYGAPAKGNTLLNYCNIGTDIIDYTVDKSPHKQDLFLPGTHIPIFSTNKILETKPDYVVILAWNLKDEIIEQMNFIREWGGKFVILLPELKIIN